MNHLSHQENRAVKDERSNQRDENEQCNFGIPRANVSCACQEEHRHNKQRPHDAEIPREAEWSVNGLHDVKSARQYGWR